MKAALFNSDSIYEILYVCDFLDSSQHKMYHVKCKVCSWEGDIRKFDIDHTQQCKHRDCASSYKTITKTPTRTQKILYKILAGMKQRCYNPKLKSYKVYGGKGIRICEEWLNDKDSFVTWALQNGYKEGLTIDRIDCNKNYCPENCRWISFSDNAKYKSSTHMIQVDGEVHSGRDWAILLNVSDNIINKIYKKYGEDVTIRFIKARKENPFKKINYPTESWLEVYNIL